MADRTRPPDTATPPSVARRNARLKVALKANMARRKAQARSRRQTADATEADAPGFPADTGQDIGQAAGDTSGQDGQD